MSTNAWILDDGKPDGYGRTRSRGIDMSAGVVSITITPPAPPALPPRSPLTGFAQSTDGYIPTTLFDHESLAIARLVEQYKDKEKFTQFIGKCAAQFQDVEQVSFDIISSMVLDSATGVQLDGIGDIVGEARQGRTDDAYRVRIKARVRINTSAGRTEDLLSIYSLLIPDAQVVLNEYPPAGFILLVTGVAIPIVDDLADILNEAKSAGVRTIFEWSPTTPELTFSFADCPDGLGWGDSSDASVGGALSGAL